MIALTRSQQAEWILIGSFLDVGSVAKKAMGIIEKKEINMSFALSGEKERFSLEDFACAEAIAVRLPKGKVYFSDKALAVLLAFKQMENTYARTL